MMRTFGYLILPLTLAGWLAAGPGWAGERHEPGADPAATHQAAGPDGQGMGRDGAMMDEGMKRHMKRHMEGDEGDPGMKKKMKMKKMKKKAGAREREHEGEAADHEAHESEDD